MKVAAGAAEKEPPDAGQHRVPEIFVQRRHGVGLDAAFETIAHHELVAVAQFLEKGTEVREIVTVVGVAHDDVLAAGRLDAALKRAAVTFSAT